MNVVKNLKMNQSQDPNGMINELFSPEIMGVDLLHAMLSLVNGIKETFFFPEYVIKENITTIFKSGSRLSLHNDRGIFLQTVFKKVLDGLIYNDKYEHIDEAMSDSNIGGRKNKNIKNHLFVVYGVMNSYIKEEKSCLDIQIYDLVQAFDSLWLDDCLNDIYDSLPEEERDDKVALMYEGNRNNLIAVNTAVGLTERVNATEVVLQGGKFGPIECANSNDIIGGKTYERG